jgi:hypothetical protein
LGVLDVFGHFGQRGGNVDLLHGFLSYVCFIKIFKIIIYFIVI